MGSAQKENTLDAEPLLERQVLTTHGSQYATPDTTTPPRVTKGDQEAGCFDAHVAFDQRKDTIAV